MARHKDENWNLNEGSPNKTGGETVPSETVTNALLMDIRDELKRLNAVLHCTNFLDIPRQLRLICQNTTKPKKKPKLTSVKRRAA